MKIAVIGTGYVGLVSGTCLAETGNNVTCVDIDESKVNRLKAGEVIIYEPGLDVIFDRNVKGGRLHFTTDMASAIEDAEIIFLALPTPPDEDGSADLSYVLAVAQKLGELMKEYKIIVNKSTVPIGTADRVKETIAENYTGEFDVVSNPEFLREGMAVDDFLKPDRVVVGTRSERAREKMKRLYEPYVRQGNPIIFMDERSSEMTKYAANSYLATRISFMNELAQLCEKVGADVEVVRQGMGTDSRIGKRFLFPGLGYGGSCFPKDVSALYKISKENDYEYKILNAVMAANQNQRQYFTEKIVNHFGEDLKGKTFALWGLAFKPNTDDIREAPALYIIDNLINRGASIQAYDPEAMENVKEHYGDRWGDKLSYGEDMYSILGDKDALIIVTEWPVFRTPDFEKIGDALKEKVIFDGRNLYDVDSLEKRGFHYESIGRKTVN